MIALPGAPDARIIRSRVRNCHEPFLRANANRNLAASPRRDRQYRRARGERYPVRRTLKRGLRQVDFVFDENEIRGLEQNPETKSRWAQMARDGKRFMQLISVHYWL